MHGSTWLYYTLPRMATYCNDRLLSQTWGLTESLQVNDHARAMLIHGRDSAHNLNVKFSLCLCSCCQCCMYSLYHTKYDVLLTQVHPMMHLPSIAKVVEWHDYPPAAGKPSCLQTTIASLISQKVSHMVPHAPLEHSSTRPSIVVVPFTSLKSPVAQGVPDAER